MVSWLVGLLRAAWFAGTLPIIIASVPSSRLSFIREPLLEFAKRGKIKQSSSYAKFTVPQRFFCHFYVVAVVWTTLLLSATWMFAYKLAPLDSKPSLFPTLTSHLTGGSHIFSFQKSRLTPIEHRYRVWRSVFLLFLMEIHVLRRLIETVYVFKYSPSARMHFLGYLTGLYYYIAAPLSLCCSWGPEVFRFSADLVAEFIVKGKNRMPEFEFEWWESATPLMKLRWHQCIGAAIFLWGWLHQRNCHAILGSLRENAEHINDYVIPHGDWFEIVSSPHYLAEIVIYTGLLVASGGADLTIWLLFGFVVANLVFAAAETQRWYLRKFDTYPSNRYAIIPYIY